VKKGNATPSSISLITAPLQIHNDMCGERCKPESIIIAAIIIEGVIVFLAISLFDYVTNNLSSLLYTPVHSAYRVIVTTNHELILCPRVKSFQDLLFVSLRTPCFFML